MSMGTLNGAENTNENGSPEWKVGKGIEWVLRKIMTRGILNKDSPKDSGSPDVNEVDPQDGYDVYQLSTSYSRYCSSPYKTTRGV
jgi:hypothetical protein